MTAGPVIAAASSNGSGPAAVFDPGDAVWEVGDAVAVLQERVAARMTAVPAPVLDPTGRRLWMKTLVWQELESWLTHRAGLGLAAPSGADEQDLVDSVLAALSGLGRLEPLLARTDVEDIFFAGSAPTVLRLAGGRKVPGPALAESDEKVLALVQQLAATLGDGSSREFSTSRPLLALRLKSVALLGARLSAVTDLTPGPSGTIRVHRHVETSLAQLRDLGMLDSVLYAFLSAAVAAGAKIMVSGAPAAGKTTLLRALCAAVPLDAMVVTVEDDRELGLHVIPRRDPGGALVTDEAGRVVPLRPAALVRAYEARPANSEGVGEVSMGDCLRQALRDSPDVLVVGETRGADVVHLLDAATNGIASVMCTIHSETAEGVFDRVVQMVRKASPPLPADYALRAATSLDLVVHVARTRTHERFVTEVIEVRSGGLGENGYPVVEHLFTARADGRAVPAHRPTPGLLAKLVDVGFDPDWLTPAQCDWDSAPARSGAPS